MPNIDRIAALQADMTVWRRDIHAHPELAYEEERTADFVAARLESFGIAVHRGLGGTGVVGTLHGRSTDPRSIGPRSIGPNSIGLRADMDALPMAEANVFAHASRHPGKMHACGHDGHTAMLLGAACHLARTRAFDGTVHFIFQPAEEGMAGARRMIEEGLFERFPCRQVYGMHNWPELPAGTIAVHPGPVMASADKFVITVAGHGAHAAMPHRGVDPVLVGAHIITAAQSLVSRGTDPLDSAVVSVTWVEAGTAFNIIPADARLSGTIRTFRPETRTRIHEQLTRLATSVAAGFGAEATVEIHPGYPTTINTLPEAEQAAAVAARVVGEDKVLWNPPPSMGAEDFGFMLQERPGCYVWLGHGGAGEGGGSGCLLHNPRYDFNDETLVTGASYWVTLVETVLAPAAGAPCSPAGREPT